MTEFKDTQELYTLPDGRVLCYAIYGDLDATATVVYNHGLPGVNIEALGLDAVAKKYKLRLIGIDRPGAGQSTYQENRRLVDWPQDLVAVADHLKVERFATMGVSGGVPYALACLALIPRSRCVGAAILSGIYPVSLGIDGMMLQNRLLLGLVPYCGWLIQKGFDYLFGTAAKDVDHPEKFEKIFDDSFKDKPEPDREVALQKDIRAILIESMRRSLLPGSKGAAWEIKIAASDWGFKLEDIKIEKGQLVMWHGALDMNAPVEMMKKAGAIIPRADVRVSEGEGHVSVVFRKQEEVGEALSRMLSEAS